MKAAAIVAILVPLGAAVADQRPVFRASTSLVRLEVSVVDDHGPVSGLLGNDFIVEDGGARQVVRVEQSVDTPLDLVLVAQPILSVALTSADQTSHVAAGLSAFFERVRELDRLGVVMASAPPTRLRALEFGRPSFDVRGLSEGTYGAPFDAIAAGLRVFDESDRRRALVAFTNAADFRSVVTFELLAEMARRLGPAFVLVGTPVRVFQPFGARSMTTSGMPIGDDVNGSVTGSVFPETLQLLARRTGGITVNLGSGDPAELIRQMFIWLRTRYLISYEPPAGKGWHPVRVKVGRRGTTVTVREGYFVD